MMKEKEEKKKYPKKIIIKISSPCVISRWLLSNAISFCLFRMVLSLPVVVVVLVFVAVLSFGLIGALRARDKVNVQGCLMNVIFNGFIQIDYRTSKNIIDSLNRLHNWLDWYWQLYIIFVIDFSSEQRTPAERI